MLLISTEDELLQLQKTLNRKEHYKTKFQYICQSCGKKSERRIFAYTKGLLCSRCLAKQTTKERFGVENASQSDIVKEKKKETTKQHFGVENPMLSDCVKEKLRNTNLERYGFENVSKSEAVKKHLKETNLERYGVEYFSQSADYQKQCQETWSEKSKEELEAINLKRQQTRAELYGDSNYNNRQKYRETCLQRFGVENPQLNSEIRQKVINTNLQKYGVSYLMQLPEFQERCKQIKLEKGSLNSSSKPELELKSFIEALGFSVQSGNRIILNGKELDLYIPEKQVAIEYNGLYWHSDFDKTGKSLFPDVESRQKAKKRHLEKTQMCVEKSIRLIHVFEDDWLHRKSIVMSIIKSALGVYEKRLFARKCNVQKIDLKTYKQFLIENHLQGYSYADVCLGLFYENELVQCIGIHSKGTHSKEPELVRMCIKNNYSIVGGFSRLLKHSGFDYMVSYVDLATFNGSGYTKVGFEVIKQNPPSYFYVSSKDKTHKYPRYQFTRKLIERKYLKGQLDFFDSGLTEEQNMYANGFARIWNCGTSKVVWYKKKSN